MGHFRSTSSTPPPRVLLVDDEESATCCLQMYLNKLGFLVETAKDGVEALRKITRGNFRWMVSDVKMPDMCGLELAHKARALDRNIRIAFMSAYLNEDQLQEISQANWKLFEKPLDLSALGDYLRQGTSPAAEDSEVERNFEANKDERVGA